MSPRIAETFSNGFYVYLAIITMVACLLRQCNDAADSSAVLEDRDGLEARVQTLEAAMDATQCACPEGP